MNGTHVSHESRFIKFSFLLVLGTLSIPCAIYIVYNVVKFPSIRQRFHNQTLIILVVLILCNTIFNIPTTMSFYARGRVLVKSHSFCRTWQIIDYIFTSSIIWCKAIFTLERHILVFYPIYLRSHRQQIILHHIPLILINLYLFLFYIFIHIYCPWKYHSNFNRHLCGDQCLDQSDGVSTFNWLFNILFPAFIIIFGSMGLLVRVLWTRREMQRNLRNWSKNWKMIVQLLGIAVIYSVIWLPVSVISLITMFAKTDRSAETIADHFYHLTYLCEMTLPIISLYCWPELMQRLRGGLRPTSIAPITVGAHSTN